MDNKKKIEKYIGANMAAMIIGMLLLIVGIVCIILGILAGRKAAADVEAEMFYPVDTETGVYAYVDVVGLTDWVYRDGDQYYYTLMDEEGYLYAAKISSSDVRAMSAQRTYWDDEDAAMPQPHHLMGIVRSVGTPLKDAFCEAWEMTPEEFDDYFGNRFLDATVTPGGEASSLYYVAAIFTILFGVLFLFIQLPLYHRTGKTIAALEENGLLDRVADQMDEGYVIGRNYGLLTRDFLIGRKSGVVVPTADILWAYQRNQRRNFIPVASQLMVSTRTQRDIAAVRMNYSKHGELTDVMDQLSQRNPDIILGFSGDARKAYQDSRNNG